MRKRKELQGLGVVDVGGGKKLGSIGDLVVAPENGRIVALTMGGGMLGGGNGSYISIDDVRAFGPDAVMVEGEDVVHPDSEMPDGLREARDASRGLSGKKVVTENGALLGTVHDLVIDESARRISGLTIGGGLLAADESLAADRVVSLGPDAIIVTDEATEKQEPEAAGRRSPWA